MNRRLFHRFLAGCCMSDWNAPAREVDRGELGIRGRVLTATALDLKPARHSGRRMALVIGNGAYKSPKVRALQNPQHDASDVADALQKLDFRVTRSLDATFDTFDKTTDEFSSSLQEWDDAFFFYAGHGMQIEAENYLIPVEFDPSHEQERAKRECFPAAEVQKRIKKSHVRTNIIVMDACRTPFRSGEAVRATGLALLDPGLGGYVALSALPGQKADDNSSERNGLFTKYLLQQIPQSGQSIKQAFDRVKEQVYAASNQIPPQRPWLYSDVITEFFFNARDAANSVPVSKSATDAAELLLSGKHQFEAKQFQDAAKSFEQAMRIDPENPFTYNALGASYAQLRNWSTAASLYAKAIQLNPAYAAAYFNRGVAYYNAGRYDLAVQDFSWAVDQERDDPLALALRGKTYFSLLDYDHAKEDFDHALSINSSDYVSLTGRGRIHFRQGRFRDSITDLSSSIKIRPTAEAYEIRSQAFRAIGQMAQSQADHQAALRLQPQ